MHAFVGGAVRILALNQGPRHLGRHCSLGIMDVIGTFFGI